MLTEHEAEGLRLLENAFESGRQMAIVVDQLPETEAIIEVAKVLIPLTRTDPMSTAVMAAACAIRLHRTLNNLEHGQSPE